MRSPAPRHCARRCRPRRRGARNGQLAAVADGASSRSTPMAAACARCRRRRPRRDHGARVVAGRQPPRVRAGGGSVYRPRRAGARGHTTGGGDANPGWSADGTRIGFRRGSVLMTVLAAGGTPPEPHGLTLLDGAVQLGWAPDLTTAAVVVADLLVQPLFTTPPLVAGVPAWSPTARRSRTPTPTACSRSHGGRRHAAGRRPVRPRDRAGRRTRRRCSTRRKRVAHGRGRRRARRGPS